jgi:hypothetical protein
MTASQNASARNWRMIRVVMTICGVVLAALSFLLFFATPRNRGIVCFELERWVCWKNPWIAGVAAVIGSYLIPAFLSWQWWNPIVMFQGADNRPSSSKLQFFLWTLAVIACYATFFLKAQWGPYNSGRLISIPPNLLLVMGFSITTAIGAKAITVNYLNNNQINKNQASPQDSNIDQLVKNDSGTADLTKFQMLAWTAIGLGAFAISAFRYLHHWPAGNAEISLPNIDQALMVLMGFGHGTYLGKKLIMNTTPTLNRVAPPAARGGTEVTISGSNLGNSSVNNQITFDGIPFAEPIIKSWADDSITFLFPEAPPDRPYDFGKSKPLGVLVSGQESNTLPMNIARPVLQNLTIKGETVVLSGTGFGSKTDRASLSRGVPPDMTMIETESWQETSIAFKTSQIPKVNNQFPGKLALTLMIDGVPFTAELILRA